jgi:hypothetical protein
MTRLDKAVIEVVEFLNGQKLLYMIFGGYAVLVWGRARLTEDVDFKIRIHPEQFESLIRAAADVFRIRTRNPLELLRELRVLPLETSTGIRADVVAAGLPYEEEAIRRAVPLAVGGLDVRVCTAEDLILHKIISDRPRDLEDVAGVIAKQTSKLDRVYLDPRVEEIAAGLERPTISTFYRECLKKAKLD